MRNKPRIYSLKHRHSLKGVIVFNNLGQIVKVRGTKIIINLHFKHQ